MWRTVRFHNPFRKSQVSLTKFALSPLRYSSSSCVIIDGRRTARQILDEIKQKVQLMKTEHNIVPGLAAIYVGERLDSLRYVRKKKETAAELGFKTVLHPLPSNTSQQTVLSLIDALNKDESIHGILVQLPLPQHFIQAEILTRISIMKDVDGFHPYNVGCLALRRAGHFVPWETDSGEEPKNGKDDPPVVLGNIACTPRGCVELLKRHNIAIHGKHVVILGRSNIVGLPLSLLLMHEHATLTNCCSSTSNLEGLVRQADILISAVGKPHLVKGSWLKPGVAVIDVGINFVNTPLGRRIVGDVDFEEAKRVAGYLTPVPGGVGPMTVAMLMDNTLQNADISIKHKDDMARVFFNH